MSLKRKFAELVNADIGKLYGTTEAEDIKANSVRTDKETLKSDTDVAAHAVYYSNGDVVREPHDTIQAALDAVPESTNGHAMGYTEVVGKGGGQNNEGYEVTSTINIGGNMSESRFYGSGISCHIYGNLSGPIIKNSTEDTEIAWLWVNQAGSGAGIVSQQNTHIHDVNVDDCGYIGVYSTNTNDWGVLGPYIEVKEGPTAAIATDGYDSVIGNHVVKLSTNRTIKRGIWINDGPTVCGYNVIGQDGGSGDNFGFDVAGSKLTVLGPNWVGASPQLTGSVGPTVAYQVRGSNTIGNGLVEDGTGSEGVRIASDVTGVRLSGEFPSGVNFNADVTTPGGVIIEGRVGSINQATAGNGTGQIVNGKSWVTTALGSGSIWDGNVAKAHRLGVTIEDRSVTAPYNLYKATSDGSWVQIG